MIEHVSSLDQVQDIICHANKITGMSRDVLKKTILGAMLNDNKFIVAYRDRMVVRAFMFATIENLDGEDVAFIHAAYSNKDGAMDMILARLEMWCKELSLKRMVFMTKRNPLAFQKKYKFNQIYTVMEKRIEI